MSATQTIVRTFESASSSAVHTVRLNPATGEASCTCPAWRFKRNGQPRGCKHTRQVADSALDSAPAADVSRAQAQARADVPQECPIRPMLASAMTKFQLVDFIDNPLWLLEEKWNGHRVIVRKAGALVDAWSRPADGKSALPRVLPAALVDALRHLPDGMYDGELIAGGVTASDSRSWNVTKADESKRLVLFDVLSVYGTATTDRPYTERREMLRLAVDHYTRGVGGDLIAFVAAQPVTLEAIAEIWARGGEGAVLKRAPARYQAGKRSADWLKVKQVGSMTLTIVGFKAGKCGPYSITQLRGDDGLETTVKTKGNALMTAIASDPSAYIGRRLVIGYCQLSPSGKPSPGTWDHFAGAGE